MHFKPAGPLAQLLVLALATALSSVTRAAAAGADLPAYPAAHEEKLPPGRHSGTTSCGRTITVEKSLTVNADPHLVAKWYQSRLPGSRAIDFTRMLSDEAGGNSQTSLEVISADGSQTVVVSRMNFSSAKLAEASKSLGMDRTQIGIENITPPFDQGYIALAAQGAAGGATAAHAKEQMKAMCKG
ncbi:MAG: hypothetical protein ABSB70_02745 [Candidatus Velthaea sp.]|jgi:hypothetical protein